MVTVLHNPRWRRLDEAGLVLGCERDPGLRLEFCQAATPPWAGEEAGEELLREPATPCPWGHFISTAFRNGQELRQYWRLDGAAPLWVRLRLDLALPTARETHKEACAIVFRTTPEAGP